MKIRTLNDLQDMIDAEMAWRKKELFALKSNIQSSRSRLENISLDEKRYNEIHKIILELIDHFAVQVMNAACLKVYLAENDEPIF